MKGDLRYTDQSTCSRRLPVLRLQVRYGNLAGDLTRTAVR